jgi:hypothetical protein
MADISLTDQIACLKREIALRKNVYPKWVGQRRMTQDEADREIARMTAALHTVMEHQKWQAPVEQLAGTKPLILYFATDEDRQELAELIKAAKPGMVEALLP